MSDEIADWVRLLNDKQNPYLDLMRGGDTHEGWMQRVIRYLVCGVVGLFVCLAGAIYAIGYQVQQSRQVPFIHTVDAHGQPVPVTLIKAGDLPDEHPQKLSEASHFVREHIKNSRIRFNDKRKLAKEFLSVTWQQTTGPAVGKFRTMIDEEKVFERIEKEGVEVVIKGDLTRITTQRWQVTWDEKVTNKNGDLLRTEEWRGEYRVTENPKVVQPGNIFGLQISDFKVQKIDSVSPNGRTARSYR